MWNRRTYVYLTIFNPLLGAYLLHRVFRRKRQLGFIPDRVAQWRDAMGSIGGDPYRPPFYSVWMRTYWSIALCGDVGGVQG